MEAETILKYFILVLLAVAGLLASGAGLLTMYALPLQIPPASLEARNLTCAKQPGLCSIDNGQAPDNLISHGRWKKAAKSPNVGDESDFQFKRWNYVSFSDDQYFVGAALVKFYYLADVFLYVVNKSSHEQFVYTGRLPFGYGVQGAYSSTSGCSKWGIPRPDVTMGGKGNWIELCASDQGLEFRARVPLVSESKPSNTVVTAFQVKMKSFEDLIVAYPLNGLNERLVYVHKVAGMPVAKGSFIQFGKSRHLLENASAGLDWTKGRLLYRTFWRWVSLNDAHAEVTRGSKPMRIEYIGINLSQDVYDVLKPNGDVFSCENAIWIMGRVVPLESPIEISVPADPRKDFWVIKSKSPSADESIDLLFRPYGARADNTSALFVVSDFIQPYGRFSGIITVKDPQTAEIIKINLKESTSFGVVENHRAFW